MFGNLFNGSSDRLSIVAFPVNLNEVWLQLVGSDPLGIWLTSDDWPANLAMVLATAPDLSMELIATGPELPVLTGWVQTIHAQPAPVPEPSSLVLLVTALLGTEGLRRWRPRRLRS